MIVKSGGGDDALVEAIHDASAHLGAECLKGYGNSEDQFDDGDDYDNSGSDEGANDSFALLRLHAKALALRR